MPDMASEYNNRKVKHESHVVVIDMVMSTFETTSTSLTDGWWCGELGSCNRLNEVRDVRLSGSSYSLYIKV